MRQKKIQVGSIVKIKPDHFKFLSETETYNNQDLWKNFIEERINATWIVTKIFPSGHCHIRCVTNTKVHFKGVIKPDDLIIIISCI